MKLKVVKKVNETDQAVSLYFQNKGGLFGKKLKYKAGQFLTVNFKLDGELHRRAYSFSSSPYTDKDLRITVKKVEKGLISNHIFNHVKEGESIKIEPITGNFFIEPNEESDTFVMFGAGSGITPILSMVKTLIDKSPNCKVFLLYANKNDESIIFKEELEQLEKDVRLKVIHILEDTTKQDSKIYSGFLTEQIIHEVFLKNGLSFEDSLYYMCGPKGFMDKATDVLLQNGAEKEAIKKEAFHLPAVKMSGKNLTSQVTIKKGNQVFDLEVKGNKTILQTAISNNMKIPYSCRSGMCSTCKGKCTEGEITMIEGHTLPEKEVAQGYVLTCVSYPNSEKVTIEL